MGGVWLWGGGGGGGGGRRKRFDGVSGGRGLKSGANHGKKNGCRRAGSQ